MTRCPPVLFALLVRLTGVNKNEKKMRLRRHMSTKNNTQYQLTAIINHSGDEIDHGHYTALLKIPPAIRWYECNDRYVKHATVPSSSSIAYILVYRQVE